MSNGRRNSDGEQHSLRTPSARSRKILALSSGPVAVLLAGLMVWQGSAAAFTADTRNIGNSWETGSVALSDDDAGFAMFGVQNVVPGDSGSRCIVVTATPSVTSTVKTYVQSLAAGGLESHVFVSMEQGSGGSFGDCAGFVAAGDTAPSMTLVTAATYNSFANGVLPWTVPAGTSTKTYKISWVFNTGALDQAAIDALQGKSASMNIEWEMQNN
jgi:hypothetical protein